MTVFFLLHTSTMLWVPSLKGTSNARIIVYNRHMLQFLHTYTYVSGILIFHVHNYQPVILHLPVIRWIIELNMGGINRS